MLYLLVPVSKALFSQDQPWGGGGHLPSFWPFKKKAVTQAGRAIILSSVTSGTSPALFGWAGVYDPGYGTQIQRPVLPYGGLSARETGRAPLGVFPAARHCPGEPPLPRGGHCGSVCAVAGDEILLAAGEEARPRHPRGGDEIRRGEAGPGLHGHRSSGLVASESCSRVDATVWLLPLAVTGRLRRVTAFPSAWQRGYQGPGPPQSCFAALSSGGARCS